MSHACTPILVGVVSPVSEILLLSKTTKFPFRPMDYSPWSSKNLIDQNRLKKFMQVGIDVTCTHTYFGRRSIIVLQPLLCISSHKVLYMHKDSKKHIVISKQGKIKTGD